MKWNCGGFVGSILNDIWGENFEKIQFDPPSSPLPYSQAQAFANYVHGCNCAGNVHANCVTRARKSVYGIDSFM